MRTGSRRESIELRSQLSEMTRLSDFLDDLGEAWGLSGDFLYGVQVALDEVVSNTIRHGYDDSRYHRIRIVFEREGGELVMKVEDDAAEFNPLTVPEPDLTLPLRNRPVGGLGIFLVRKLMDSVSYERCGDKNILTLSKKLETRAGHRTGGTA